MSRFDRDEQDFIRGHTEARGDMITRTICYLAFNYAAQNPGPASAAAGDVQRPVRWRAEEIVLAAGMNGDTAYDWVENLLDRGRRMLIDPSMNPAPLGRVAMLDAYYDEVDAYFDALEAS